MDLAALDRQDGHDGALRRTAVAKYVVDDPAAVDDVEHGHVGLLAHRQAAQAGVLADGAGRVDGAHLHHPREGETHRQEAGHHLGHAVDGADAARHGEVGTDAVRLHALVENPFADIEAEVGATVGGVQPDAPLVGFTGFGHQVAVAVQHSARVGGKEVRYDVPRLHDGQQFANDLSRVAFLGVADVHHQGNAGFFGGALGETGHLHAHNLQGRRNHARLDAADGAVAFLDDLYGAFQVDAAGRENVGGGGEAGAADVQERDNLGGVAGDDVRRESTVGVAAAAAGIHHGGYAGAHTAHVGIYAIAVDAFVHMGVQVDEAGGNVFALDLNDAGRFVGGNVGGDGGDFAVFDCDVVGSVQVLGWVDNCASLDDQVIHCWVPSDGVGSYGLFGDGQDARDGLPRSPEWRPLHQVSLRAQRGNPAVGRQRVVVWVIFQVTGTVHRRSGLRGCGGWLRRAGAPPTAR